MGNQDDRMFEKLDDWVGVLDEQIIEMYFQRRIFNEVQEIIGLNPKIKPSYFLLYLSLWYSSTMSINVRRLLDADRNTISYMRFLTCIRENPKAVSRTRYLQRHLVPPMTKERANIYFDSFAGSGNEYLDLAKVNLEISELTEETKKLRDFIDKSLAHFDISRPESPPNFEDLNGAIDHLGKLHKKYFNLMRCLTPQLETEVISDWKAIFRIPWIVSPKM